MLANTTGSLMEKETGVRKWVKNQADDDLQCEVILPPVSRLDSVQPLYILKLFCFAIFYQGIFITWSGRSDVWRHLKVFAHLFLGNSPHPPTISQHDIVQIIIGGSGPWPTICSLIWKNKHFNSSSLGCAWGFRAAINKLPCWHLCLRGQVTATC